MGSSLKDSSEVRELSLKPAHFMRVTMQRSDASLIEKDVFQVAAVSGAPIFRTYSRFGVPFSVFPDRTSNTSRKERGKGALTFRSCSAYTFLGFLVFLPFLWTQSPSLVK